MTDLSREIVYQIYPKSFQDSDGDGIGDLKGILEHLDYLASLGVTMLWLNPVYPSPQRDNGYDVSDYCAIDPMFGTMEDMEKLIQEADRRGMKIMLDMVFNHTSTEHEWFKKALAGDEHYQKYYFFRKGKDGLPPTNWESKFGGSCWKYVPELDQYYLHLFDETQADLDWQNEEVREELKKILRFWRGKGVRGFRFDVINLISKDAFEDDFEGVGKRFYTDGEQVDAYLQELRADALDDTIITVGEMSATSIENCAGYTNPDRKELSMAFSFHHLKVDYENGDKWTDTDFDFMALKNLFNDWDVKTEALGGWNALFLNCHDQPRSMSRFGDDVNYPDTSAKMLAGVTLTRRGTPYIYMGEEIGMPNAHFESIDEYRDVESLNYYDILKEKGHSEAETLSILARKSRDNARTPMRWSKDGGFSGGDAWIPDARRALPSAEENLQDPDSVYHYYQKLIELRKESPAIQQGTTVPILEDDPQVYAYRRVCPDEEIVCLHNFFGEEAPIDLDLDDYSLLLSNYPQKNETSGLLRPYESRILRKSA